MAGSVCGASVAGWVRARKEARQVGRRRRAKEGRKEEGRGELHGLI